MILRTPPQRKRRIEPVPEHEIPVSDRQIIPYAEPSDEIICTYHCRQMVKSEVLVALNSAEKQILEYKSKLEALSTELCNSEEERIKHRDLLCSAQQELQASKGRENAMEERLLKEISEYEERYLTQFKRCHELELKLKREAEARKTAELSAETAKEKAYSVEKELLMSSESNEREKSRLRLSFSHLQDESSLSLSRVNAELERVRLQAENSEKEVKVLKKSLVDFNQQLNECLHEKSEVMRKLSSYDSPLAKTSSPSDHLTLVKHLNDELREAEAELQEARQLKSSHMNKELLLEQLSEEKGRREKAEKELSKLQEILTQTQMLESELTSWKLLLKQIPDVSCYADIPKKYHQLQKETIENMLKVGEANASLKELQVTLEMANASKEHAEKECKLAKEMVKCASLDVKRLELTLSSVSEECEKLKKDAASKQKSEFSGQANETGLEALIELKEQAIRGLENNLCEQREVINHQYDKMMALNESLSIEIKRSKSLERESVRLHSQISLLESKLGHGDYSETNTKVLRMVNCLGIDNEAKRIIETLQAELQKSKAKLQAVEELSGQSEAGGIINVDLPGKLSQLKEQIAKLEKREERYKSVFAEKISIFRRACCSLFGYKIVMDDQQRPNGIPVTRFTLQSIYAQSDDEKLEFDYESGNAIILVNDYISQAEINQQVEIFVRRMNSVPAFTANLTVESFNKRTLG